MNIILDLRRPAHIGRTVPREAGDPLGERDHPLPASARTAGTPQAPSCCAASSRPYAIIERL